jgi:hypothetical protein
LAAQAAETGRIVGRVIDAATGTGLVGAGVQITGTTTGTLTSADGRFQIIGAPAGTVSLTVRRIGYAPKTVTGIVVERGAVVEQEIALAEATLVLTAQIVTAEAERGTVDAALSEQRSAIGIVTAVTAEQMGKSPDSDAAKAVQRVSGVTVQDGRSVFVRGLGERY